MRKLACIPLLLILFACFAGAQDWAKKQLEASPRHQQWVDVKHGNRTVKCFVVYPERKDKAPVIVMIHEIFGMSDWAMSMADQLAEAGYIVVAPDLLSGMGPHGGRTSDFDDQQKIMEAVSGLPDEQVTADLNAAADYGKSLPSANGKLAVAGFCWGGSESFRFATNRKDLNAAFVFYGIGPMEPAEVAKIACPVYGFYGGIDSRVTSTVEAQSKLMRDAGKSYESMIYEGAGHGFMRAGQAPEAKPENKAARDAAFKRWMDLMGKL